MERDICQIKYVRGGGGGRGVEDEGGRRGEEDRGDEEEDEDEDDEDEDDEGDKGEFEEEAAVFMERVDKAIWESSIVRAPVALAADLRTDISAGDDERAETETIK